METIQRLNQLAEAYNNSHATYTMLIDFEDQCIVVMLVEADDTDYIAEYASFAHVEDAIDFAQELI